MRSLKAWLGNKRFREATSLAAQGMRGVSMVKACAPTDKIGPPSPGAMDVAKSSLNAVSGRNRTPLESSDDYPAVVAMLDEKTRVIECAARIQWIIQRRVRGGCHPWQSRYFCRTKAGLLLYARPITPELLALPGRFPRDWPPSRGGEP
jgi:hypothetical protein